MDPLHSVSSLASRYKFLFAQNEEEEEVKRNWAELPEDVISLIFMKLGAVNILVIAQWVCTSWWKLSRQPHLFCSIHLEQVLTLSDHIVMLYSTSKLSEGLAREAINRSCGQLVEFSVSCIDTEDILHFMSEKCQSLRCLRLIYCSGIADDGLTKVCKQLPQLEKLELCGCPFSLFETVDCLFPNLKSFRLNYLSYTHSCMFDGTALLIVETMPELRHLNLFGNMLTDFGLKAILHGCPHLQSLDLRRCFNLKFEGLDIEEMSRNRKLRFPYDSDDDFEYHIESFSEDEDNNNYAGEEEDIFSYGYYILSEGLAREAIDRSCGQLVQFSVKDIATDELLLYLSKKSSSLRCLRLRIDEECVTDAGLIEMAKNLPHLEELVIIQYYSEFSKDVFKTFGSVCPNLKPCWIIDPGYYFPVIDFDLVALAIAENMPELRRLHLFGNTLEDNELREILDGCPHLESLDLRQCFHPKFGGDLKERCANIKAFTVSE